MRDAVRCYHALINGKKPVAWYGIEKYFAQAEEVLLTHKRYEACDTLEQRSKVVFPKFDYRLAFFLALHEKHREGFHNYRGKSTANTQSRNVERERRRLILRALGNRVIPATFEDAQLTFKNMINELVEYHKGCKARYVWKQIIVLNNIMDLFDLLPGAFNHLRSMKKSLAKTTEELLDDSTKHGQLDESLSFPSIPLDEPDRALEQMLAHAYRTDIDLYMYCLLALTTGLREVELKRLCEKRLFYLNADGTLKYDGRGIKDGADILVQKTMKKTKIEDLPNPMLSIIGRIALLHFNPELNPKNYFQNPNGMRASPVLKDYHGRCLRPTCASNLAMCSAVTGEGRSDLSEVQTRLAHTSRVEIDRRYAPRRSSGLPPLAYFKCPEVVHRDIGNQKDVNITKGSTLWDIYLLCDFIKRFTNDSKVGPRKAALWASLIEKEALEFQRLNGVNQSTEKVVMKFNK